MRRIVFASLLTAAPLLTLDGCASPAVKACQETYAAGTQGYEACAAAALRRDNEEIDRRVLEGRRSRE